MEQPDVVVIGAGIASVNEWANALDAGAKVISLLRNPAPDESLLTSEAADSPAMLAEEHREVLQAIRRLPERQREVIMLRYWCELSESEISATLGISVGAVKSNASRGRDAIAEILGGVR